MLDRTTSQHAQWHALGTDRAAQLLVDGGDHRVEETLTLHVEPSGKTILLGIQEGREIPETPLRIPHRAAERRYSPLGLPDGMQERAVLLVEIVLQRLHERACLALASGGKDRARFARDGLEATNQPRPIAWGAGSLKAFGGTDLEQGPGVPTERMSQDTVREPDRFRHLAGRLSIHFAEHRDDIPNLSAELANEFDLLARDRRIGAEHE
jgi:hypothetical protein